jgi:hypothetical protein
VATSTLRAAILVAAVVLGIIVIRSGFPQNASQGVTGSPPPVTTTSPSPTSSSSTGPSPSGSALPNNKVWVLVLNGAGKTGLAGQVTDVLKADHYRLKLPGDAPRQNTTTIFYRPDSLAEAQGLQSYMNQRFGISVDIAEAPANFPSTIRLEVILGKDFLTAPTPPP